MHLLRILLVGLALSSASLVAQESGPRILDLAGAPHAKALVLAVDSSGGTCSFSWLDAAGKAVDSGNSIARFTPVVATPATETEPATYAEPSDATLAAAIANPPAQVSTVPTWHDATLDLTLAIAADDQAKFTADVTGYSAKALAGDIDLDAETTVIRDATGTEHTLTIRAYLRLIGRLHAALRVQWEAGP